MGRWFRRNRLSGGFHPLAKARGRQLNATTSSTRQKNLHTHNPGKLIISPHSLLHIMSDSFEVKARLQEALQYKRQHSQSSFRWLERQFRVHKDRMRNHSRAPHHHTICHIIAQRAEWLIHWGVVTASSKIHTYAIRAYDTTYCEGVRLRRGQTRYEGRRERVENE